MRRDANEIIPRWEWRAFGESFGAAEAALRATPPESVVESDELYLLAADCDASVKVREGLMDIKRLEATNTTALERWRPVMKAAFPLPASDVGAVMSALGRPSPHLTREEYGLDQLVDELVSTDSALRAVEVHKRRERRTFGGCMAELTEIRTSRASIRTIAVESEDPGLVTGALRQLELESHPNVNVPRGLKTLLGFGARRYAVIDVGTNSVKFHVGERRADATWRTIVDRAEVTRLGEGLAESGELGAEPIARTVGAITDMATEARDLGAREIAAVGTAWMRIASNSATLVDAALEATGVSVEVILGDEEARLAYLAVTSELRLGEGQVVVFDTGGGSSQFTFGHGGLVDERFSVNVGAARFTEQFGLDGIVSAETLQAVLAAIAGDLDRLDRRSTPDALVGMGGAVTNLTAVKYGLVDYDPTVVQGTILDRAEIDRQIELYRTRTSDGRREIVGLQPKRAEVILAGACIVRSVLDKLQRDALMVSDRGLRHGLLAERFGS